MIRKEKRVVTSDADATTLFYIRPSFLFLTHVRIKDCRRGGEGFFDCVRAEPAEHVQRGSRLIVGAGSSCAAEGLLSDHCAGALVIDIEVSGSVAKGFLHLCNHLAILCEDSAGQSVGRSGIADAEGLIECIVIIDIDGDDGTEDLRHHGLIVRGLAEDYGRLNEPALAVIIGSACNDFAVRGCLCAVDEALAGLKRSLVDDCAHEGIEFLNIANLNGSHKFLNLLLGNRPNALRDKDAGASRALLALILKRTADNRCAKRIDISCVVREDKVLTAGLTYQSRVAMIVCDIFADALPDTLEYTGGAGEVEA